MAKPRSSKSVRDSVRQASRAAYQRAILDAALRVFGRMGFRDAKIADIAAEAGVATGTLYNYFSSKEDVFQSILADGRELMRAEVRERAKIADPIARIRAIVRALLGFLEENGVLFAIHIQHGGGPFRYDCENADEAALRLEFQTTLEEAVADAGDAFRQDYTATELARGLGGLFSGVIIEWAQAGCPPGLRDQSDFIMDMFLHGVSSQ